MVLLTFMGTDELPKVKYHTEGNVSSIVGCAPVIGKFIWYPHLEFYMRSVATMARNVWHEVTLFLSYTHNKIWVVLVALFLAGYQSLQFFLEHPDWYVTFSPDLTIWLQETFSTTSLDYALSYYYPFGFMICLLLLVYLVVKEGRQGWKWGYAILACWIAHFVIEMFYPVAPPLRWESGARAIRLEVFPLSDILVSVKYGGMPSGHFGYIFIGFLIARFNFLKTRSHDYRGYMLFFLANLVLTTFTVLYLGEHTWEDLAGSFLIFGGLFYLFSQLVEPTIFPSCAKNPAAAMLRKMEKSP
jgi:hypothetical protein